VDQSVGSSYYLGCGARGGELWPENDSAGVGVPPGVDVRALEVDERWRCAAVDGSTDLSALGEPAWVVADRADCVWDRAGEWFCVGHVGQGGCGEVGARDAPQAADYSWRDCAGAVREPLWL